MKRKKRWTRVVAVGIGGGILVSSALVLFFAMSSGAANNANNCSLKKIAAAAGGDEDIQDLATLEQQTEVARKIASVLVEFGLDENKAYGAVGNAEQESSLMEPFVELNFLWNYWKNANSVEEAKQEINKYGTRAEDLFVNGWGTIRSAYPNHNLDESGYIGGDPKGGHWVGFGIWQWTGYNGVMPYFDWADANGLERANIDNILAFAVSDSSEFFKPYTSQGDYYYKRLEKIRDMPEATSPAQGADYWLGHYEFADGRTASSGANEGHKRIENANKWAVRLGKEKLDTAYAKSILSIANASSAAKNSAKNKAGCRTGSSIADGGHPYANDYYFTAAFQWYNSTGTIRASNSGNYWHNGIDTVGSWEEGLNSPRRQNKEIHSVLDGEVIAKSPAYGQVLIKSDRSITGLKDDIVLEYTHLAIDADYNGIAIGDQVKAGQFLANEGDTGSPGVHHLHFGVLNAAAVEAGEDLWSSLNSVGSSYGSDTSAKIIDPGIVLDGIEPGWLDSKSPNYLGDDFIQPTPLVIRVDGTTSDDPRIKK